jgi:hypothetical protein
MPMTESELQDVRGRVWRMFMDTIATFQLIEQSAEVIYGDRAPDVRAAINEYLDDFIRNNGASGEPHPETLIYQTSRQSFQRAGFYGAQLNLKERQVTTANRTLRERLSGGVRALWNRPFSKWIDIINNFLSSLMPATGMGEALKELKDCLRDELPDDDSNG